MRSYAMWIRDTGTHGRGCASGEPPLGMANAVTHGNRVMEEFPMDEPYNPLEDHRLTYLAVRHGVIGPGGQWKTLAAYARAFGIANSTATLWRRLGQAMVEVGVDPDSDLYWTLYDDGAATNRHVGAEIERSGATPKSLAAVVGKHYDLHKSGGARRDMAAKWRNREQARQARADALAHVLGGDS
jgi:hypothetical protein